MQCSAEINEIAAALAKAQGIIKNPEKTRMNPHFKAWYATLATGLDCIRPPLSENGIAIVQATNIDKDGVTLTTRLIHTSGQYIGCVYPVAATSADHQKLGAALTYAKRQALFSLVGVCGDDEDDGNIASNGNGVPKGATITEAQVADLRAEIEARGADEQKFLKYMKVGSLAALPATELLNAFAALAAKVKK